MAVLPRTSILSPVPGEAVAQSCNTSTLSVVAIAIGITFTVTVLMLKFVPVWGFLRLLVALGIKRLNRCRKNREKSKSPSPSDHADPYSGTQLAGESNTFLPPPTSVPASDVQLSHNMSPLLPHLRDTPHQLPLTRNDSLQMSPPRSEVSQGEKERALSEQWTLMWNQQESLNPLQPRCKCVAAARSKDAGQKPLVQDLTMPTDGLLTAAPAHVDISQNPMTKFGSSSAIVHPLEVERNLNAVFFPQFDSSSTGPASCQTAPLSQVTRPLQPARKFWKAPIEWGTEESQPDPLNGRIISVIDGPPAQWEPTVGTDRQIFGVECDDLETLRKRRRSEQNVPEMIDLECGVARHIHAVFSSAGVHGADTRLQHRSDGTSPALVSTSETRWDDVCSLEPDTDHGYSLYNMISSTLDVAGPSKWDVMDLSCTQVIAASACQQAKYFAKFNGADPTQFSKNVAPVTEMVHVSDTSHDEHDSPVDSLYADPSYIPRISGVNVAESSPPASTESSIASAGTEASSWSTSPATFSSASSIESGDQHKTVVLWSSEAHIASSSSSPPEKSPEAIVLLLKYACPICGSDFRTPGLLSTHHNRKHNPRYHCEECNASFGLWKDLERHTHTVHMEKYGPLRTFTCPNVGCSTPRKTFTRKDNFQRHFERCRLAVAARSVVQEQVHQQQFADVGQAPAQGDSKTAQWVKLI